MRTETVYVGLEDPDVPNRFVRYDWISKVCDGFLRPNTASDLCRSVKPTTSTCDGIESRFTWSSRKRHAKRGSEFHDRDHRTVDRHLGFRTGIGDLLRVLTHLCWCLYHLSQTLRFRSQPDSWSRTKPDLRSPTPPHEGPRVASGFIKKNNVAYTRTHKGSLMDTP